MRAVSIAELGAVGVWSRRGAGLCNGGARSLRSAFGRATNSSGLEGSCRRSCGIDCECADEPVA